MTVLAFSNKTAVTSSDTYEHEYRCFQMFFMEKCSFYSDDPNNEQNNSVSKFRDTNALFNCEAIYVLVFQGSQINLSFCSSYGDWDGSAAALIKAF